MASSGATSRPALGAQPDVEIVGAGLGNSPCRASTALLDLDLLAGDAARWWPSLAGAQAGHHRQLHRRQRGLDRPT